MYLSYFEVGVWLAWPCLRPPKDDRASTATTKAEALDQWVAKPLFADDYRRFILYFTVCMDYVCIYTYIIMSILTYHMYIYILCMLCMYIYIYMYVYIYIYILYTMVVIIIHGESPGTLSEAQGVSRPQQLRTVGSRTWAAAQLLGPVPCQQLEDVGNMCIYCVCTYIYIYIYIMLYMCVYIYTYYIIYIYMVMWVRIRIYICI